MVTEAEVTRLYGFNPEGGIDAADVAKLHNELAALRARVAELEMIRNPGYMDEKMAARFRSGNSIAVERAWVTRVEWDAWLQRLANAERAIPSAGAVPE